MNPPLESNSNGPPADARPSLAESDTLELRGGRFFRTPTADALAPATGGAYTGAAFFHFQEWKKQWHSWSTHLPPLAGAPLVVTKAMLCVI